MMMVVFPITLGVTMVLNARDRFSLWWQPKKSSHMAMIIRPRPQQEELQSYYIDSCKQGAVAPQRDGMVRRRRATVST